MKETLSQHVEATLIDSSTCQLKILSRQLGGKALELIIGTLPQLQEQGITTLRLNLQKVQFFFSESVGNLVSLQQEWEKRGGTLQLSHATAGVVEILFLTGMNDYFRFTGTPN